MDEQTSKKILIVEDEKALSRALQLKLSTQGYEVDIAENGEEAVQMSKDKCYDLMLLDLVMPTMDGFAVLERLKAEGCQTPIIVSSNLGQNEDLERAKSFGIKDYFIKSNTPLKEIVANVETILT